MPKYTIEQIWNSLVVHVSNGNVVSLRNELDKCEKSGLRREQVVNYFVEDKTYQTVLHLAANNGQVECLRLLLQSGGNPNLLSSFENFGETPLHLAAQQGHHLCIEILLEYGANINIRNTLQSTPQDFVLGNVACEKIFQHTLAQQKIPERTTGDLNRVQALHELVSTSYDKFCELYDLLPQRHWDLGARWTDFFGQTLLYRAANEQCEEIVKLIISKSSNQPLPNFNNNKTPLMASFRRQNIKVSKLLLEHSPGLIFISEATDKLSPLHIACSLGNLEMLNLIFKAFEFYISSRPTENTNLTLDFYDINGKTPLYMACSAGHYNAVKALIAFYRKNSEFVSLNINALVHKSRRSPLHAAIQNGNVSMVDLLLTFQSINVNQKGRPSDETIAKLISLTREILKVVDNTNPGVKRRVARTLLAKKSSSMITDMVSAEVRERSITVVEKKIPEEIGVFEDTESGELEAGAIKNYKQNQKYKNLNTLFISPLAEAAAHANSDIISSLLLHGARDENGLACRILWMLLRLDLIQVILSYHCFCSSLTLPQAEDSSTCIEINWSHRQLPICHEKWVDKDAKFYVHTDTDEKEELDLQSAGKSKREVLIPGLHEQSLVRVFTSSSLNSVSLACNQISSLPLQLFQLPNMYFLDVSNNKITELPFKMADQLKMGNEDSTDWSCLNLREFNTSGNMLSVLPASLWKLENLCILDCSRNALERISPDDFLLTSKEYSSKLERINLSKNSLCGKVPDFVFKLPSLKVLDLSSNKIDELPASLWSSEILEELNMADNALTTLPFCEAENVYQKLYCQKKKTAIMHQESLPDSFVEATPKSRGNSVSVLSKSRSAMDFYSPTGRTSFSLLNTIQFFEYSSLKKLNISGNNLVKFPEGLACFAPNIQKLDISNNKGLKEIDIMYLPFSLQQLIAKNCELKDIGNLLMREDYESILMNCRKSKGISQACFHRSHTNLQFITKLNFSGNKLPNLQIIQHERSNTKHDLMQKAEEELQYVPNVALQDLLYPSLTVLILSDNCLTGTFNPNIGHQMKLQQVDLSNNKLLQTIPLEFSYLMKKRKQALNELRLSNLPNLIDPPAEYTKAKLNHLLGYLKSRLKASDCYRCIKLFFVGNGERGKTTLLRRLQGLSEDKDVERTVGIDIEAWVYPDQNLDRGDRRKPAKFLAWDFAGQDIYHTTHQCFYSKRSLYLALFRLTDKEAGIEELHKWLKSINLRARGSPVIIVGTHLDLISDQKMVKTLEDEVRRRYFNNPSYPKVIDVMSVSCLKRKFNYKSKVKELRRKIYDIACHLALDGPNLTYKAAMSEDDPKALFQQKVPSAFLTLQEHIERKAKEMNDNGIPPVMEEKEFRKTFGCAVSDEEELDEAVFFLHLQGSILHYDDHNLRHAYFLDPQWLPKMMADVIYPATKENKSVAKLEDLFYHRNTMTSLKEYFINYMEKFEVVMRINLNEVVVPCCMKESVLSIPEEILCNIKSSSFYDENGDCYPPLRRFWLSNFIPGGFWPRLICAVFKDPQIVKILESVIGSGVSNVSNSVTCSSLTTTITNTSNDLHLSFWKTGFAFGYKGRVFLTMLQEENKTESFDTPLDDKVKFVKSHYRIDLNIYTNEWLALSSDLVKAGSKSLSFNCTAWYISGLATKMLLLLTMHLKKLSTDYFLGMIELPATEFCTYMACWKCFSDSSEPEKSTDVKGKFMVKDGDPRSVFIVEDNIHTEPEEQYVTCCVHGKLQYREQAPELIFWDLASELDFDETSELKIFEEDILGEGGFGVVCKGELHPRTDRNIHHNSTINVAVKFFMKDASANLQNYSLSQALKRQNKPSHLLHAYKEVRQEVSFLSTLSHPNLTKLYGVRTSPHLCLILEMAPGKSLDHMLKHYHNCGEVLEPTTLKQASLQIALGLEYLHANERAHLDIKSPNILLWKFPSPNLDHKDRVKESKDVLLKIADYGISQLTIGLTLTQSTGTPGYMAPELLKGAEGTISSDKLDVFAYAMVLFELLSQSPPFPKGVNPVQSILDRKRPQLDSRKARSPILLQDLTCRCWNHEPENRPSMKEVVECIQSPEFDKLRDEAHFENISSISSVCVCRFSSQEDEEVLPSPKPKAKAPEKQKSSVLHMIKQFEKISKGNTNQSKTSKEFSESKGKKQDINFLKNTLTLGDLQSEKHEETDCNQGVGSSFSKVQGSGSTEDTLTGQITTTSEPPIKVINPHTQIWFSAYNEDRTNIMNICTFVDNNPDYYNFRDYVSGDEITAMCAVGNMMWAGTNSGEIKIFYASTLQIKFACTLIGEELKSDQDLPILAILYVARTRTVLVSVSSGEIWSFYDTVIKDCLQIQCRFKLNFPCLYLTQVGLNKDNFMVCGVVENNQILLLKHSSGSAAIWTDRLYPVNPSDSTLSDCSHITCTNFSNSGNAVQLIWVSYKTKPYLISFDVFLEKQQSGLDCAQIFCCKDDTFGQITDLSSLNNRLLVSTNRGYVGIIDGINLVALKLLKCHEGPIFKILPLPEQVTPILCVEVPFHTYKEEYVLDDRKSASTSEPLPQKECVKSAKNSEDSCIFATLGCGRYSYFSNKENNRFSIAEQPPSTSDSDLFLRMWKV